eukprot:scaffold2280_cov430-Prasinococcus_capsulatus_cf.AAC.4
MTRVRLITRKGARERSLRQPLIPVKAVPTQQACAVTAPRSSFTVIVRNGRWTNPPEPHCTGAA